VLCTFLRNDFQSIASPSFRVTIEFPKIITTEAHICFPTASCSCDWNRLKLDLLEIEKANLGNISSILAESLIGRVHPVMLNTTQLFSQIHEAVKTKTSQSPQLAEEEYFKVASIASKNDNCLTKYSIKSLFSFEETKGTKNFLTKLLSSDFYRATDLPFLSSTEETLNILYNVFLRCAKNDPNLLIKEEIESGAKLSESHQVADWIQASRNPDGSRRYRPLVKFNKYMKWCLHCGHHVGGKHHFTCYTLRESSPPESSASKTKYAERIAFKEDKGQPQISQLQFQ
jgi:hypothetical protein